MDLASASDETLMQALPQQMEALDALYERHSRAAMGLATRMVGERETAEEIVQEAFLALWRNAGRYQAGRGSVRTSGSPGTICGICWIAPKAAPSVQANMIVVTIVVRRSAGENSSPRLGRRSVPAARFSAHTGDSGRNGRIRMSGIAGINPDISV